MASIEIDVCESNTIALRDYLVGLIAGRSVNYTVVTLVSSSGGWPIVRLDGDHDHLVAIVREWAGPNGDADYHISTISN